MHYLGLRTFWIPNVVTKISTCLTFLHFNMMRKKIKVPSLKLPKMETIFKNQTELYKSRMFESILLKHKLHVMNASMCVLYTHLQEVGCRFGSSEVQLGNTARTDML